VIVVADAGPLHYLILMGRVDLLPTLFGETVVPAAVRQELTHPRSPAAVREWMDSPPAWARFLTATDIDSSLALGRGEREAIALAIELHADLLLVDDKKARRLAQERGIRVTGTLGLLKIAHDRGLIELPDAIQRLRSEGFRLSDRLVRDILTHLSHREPESG
jgi:predicted nucleic acid-binding protein